MKVVMTCKVNLSALRYRVEIIDGHVPNVSHAHVATYIVFNHPFLTPFFTIFEKSFLTFFYLFWPILYVDMCKLHICMHPH